mgnify:FL=1
MDYEEYMRSVLGYNQIPNNIYTGSSPTYDNYYYDTSYLNSRNYNNVNDDEIENLYPDIYRIIYPMVCKSCSQNSGRDITRDLVDTMTDDIYYNIEPDERQPSANTARPVLKNGDVRNPNAREPETRGETRQGNPVLKDLIRILVLRELLRRRPNRPLVPPHRPPRPPMPPFRPYWWIISFEKNNNN